MEVVVIEGAVEGGRGRKTDDAVGIADMFLLVTINPIAGGRQGSNDQVDAFEDGVVREIDDIGIFFIDIFFR